MGGIAGKGTEFRRWNSATGEWEAQAEITNITLAGQTREIYDNTTLDTTGGYRTGVPGFRSGGTYTLAMNFTRDTYEQMIDDFESDTLQNYEICFPDDENTTKEFSGYVTELGESIPVGDIIKNDVSIFVYGQPTINSGSGPSAGA